MTQMHVEHHVPVDVDALAEVLRAFGVKMGSEKAAATIAAQPERFFHHLAETHVVDDLVEHFSGDGIHIVTLSKEVAFGVSTTPHVHHYVVKSVDTLRPDSKGLTYLSVTEQCDSETGDFCLDKTRSSRHRSGDIKLSA